VADEKLAAAEEDVTAGGIVTGTAAAVGAIAGAIIILAKRQFTDMPSVLIALVAILILIRFKKIQEPFIILVAALTGLLLKIWT